MTKFRINIYLNNNNKCEMINIIYMNIYILQKDTLMYLRIRMYLIALNIFKNLKCI